MNKFKKPNYIVTDILLLIVLSACAFCVNSFVLSTINSIAEHFRSGYNVQADVLVLSICSIILALNFRIFIGVVFSRFLLGCSALAVIFCLGVWPLLFLGLSIILSVVSIIIKQRERRYA